MIVILSPSKTIDQSLNTKIADFTIPVFLKQSHQIVNILKKLNTTELSKLLSTSPKLSQLSYDRYQFWNKSHNLNNSKQAILSFKGEVYSGLDADSLTKNEINFAQKHLILLSGLYGILKSLDLIQPYRLEIATKLSVGKQKDLYSFWRTHITNELKELISKSSQQTLINLASNEYYKSIDKEKLGCRIITPIFKEYRNGDYKIVTIFAKKARGLMTRYIIKNSIEVLEDIKSFDKEGYYFNNELSNEDNFVFTRG